METMRIQKFLSLAGICSRRKAEEYILQGKVFINNKKVKLGEKVNPQKDRVFFDGREVKAENDLIYYAVNKPVGVTSSLQDVHAKKLVTDLVPSAIKVWPVGRLDRDSSGLIILTNDGELTNELTHPRYKHEKEYQVKVRSFRSENKFNANDIQNIILAFRKGITLYEGKAKCDKIELINFDESKNIITLSMVLHQGWKRQIRRMCEKVGLYVMELKRIRIGKLKLANISDGKYIIVEKEEII